MTVPFAIRTVLPTGVVRAQSIRHTSGTSYVFPVSPVEVNIGRIGLAYNELARPGRKPLLQKVGAQLLQVSASFVITADTNKGYDSAQSKIDALTAIAEDDVSLTIAYPGINPTTLWRITDIKFKTTSRGSNNEVLIASADVTFTEFLLKPKILPGMVRIKDVPRFRTGATTNGQKKGGNGGGASSGYDIDKGVSIIIGTGPNNTSYPGGSNP